MTAADPAFPARGLPQSGSKGLSQSPARCAERPTPPADAPRPASRSAERIIAERRRSDSLGRHAEQLVQLRAGRRVEQRLRPVGMHPLGDRIGRERRLVEAADDQLLLARVGDGVADRVDARRRGLEARRCRRPAACARAPGPTARSARASGSSRAAQQQRRAAGCACRRRCRRRRGPAAAAVALDAARLRRHDLDPAAVRAAWKRAGGAVGASKSSRRCTTATLRRGRAFHRVERRRHRCLAVADDDDAAPGVLGSAGVAMEELPLAPGVEALDLQPARLERADAGGDHHRLGDEALAGDRSRRRSGRPRARATALTCWPR